MVKKSFYVFMTALLGVMLFLVLDRIVIFFYLYSVSTGILSTNFDYSRFLFVDYFTLTIVLMLGAWYGIVLGLHWYSKVYEEQSHQGFAAHVARQVWPQRKPENLDAKMVEVRQRLEDNLWDLEAVAQEALVKMQSPEIIKPAPVKRRIVRKKAPKKLQA